MNSRGCKYTDNHDRFLPNFVHEYRDLLVVFLLNIVNFGQVDSITLQHFKATQPLIHNNADLFQDAAIILTDQAISSKSPDLSDADYAI